MGRAGSRQDGRLLPGGLAVLMLDGGLSHSARSLLHESKRLGVRLQGSMSGRPALQPPVTRPERMLAHAPCQPAL